MTLLDTQKDAIDLVAAGYDRLDDPARRKFEGEVHAFDFSRFQHPEEVRVHFERRLFGTIGSKRLVTEHDPAQVAPRKNGKKPTAPSGDLIKTSEIISHERGRNPDLQATLILTTIVEPDEKLVRDVVDAGYRRDIIVDIWSLSRLCHFLDNTPKGQWLRAKFLGIEQELLSPDLLHGAETVLPSL